VTDVTDDVTCEHSIRDRIVRAAGPLR
jgi:hypothetical protein